MSRERELLEQTLLAALREHGEAGKRSLWLTEGALWVATDWLDEELQRRLGTVSVHNWMDGVSRLLDHGIVPQPRACALLWRKQYGAPGGVAMLEILLVEVPLQLAMKALPSIQPVWQVEMVDVPQFKLVVSFQRGTISYREKVKLAQTGDCSDLAILSPLHRRVSDPAIPHVMLRLYREAKENESGLVASDSDESGHSE